MGPWWPLTSLRGNHSVAIKRVQLGSSGKLLLVSRHGVVGGGSVSFSFSCVTYPSLSVSPPRSALTVSRVHPGLSKAVHANVL